MYILKSSPMIPYGLSVAQGHRECQTNSSTSDMEMGISKSSKLDDHVGIETETDDFGDSSF